MKNIFVLFLMLIFVLPSIAEDSIHTKIEKNTWAKCELLKEEATKTKNNDILLKYYECTYKNINKKENVTEKQINEIKNNSIKSIISLCEDRYEITQNKKYLKKAYKYSKIAVNNKTSDKKVLTSAIILASMHLNTKNMLKAYDSLCIVDKKYCEKNRKEFSELMKITKQKISERRNDFLNGFAQGMQSTGTRYSTSTTTQIGNTYYTNTYSY